MNNKLQIKQLGIDSEIFDELREHFDAVLQRTFSNMQRKGCDSADISIKLTITVDKFEEVYRDRYGEMQRSMIQKPSFAHKVSASMKIKDTEQGFFKEDYELVYNGDVDEFILVPIMDRQTRMMFEEEDEE